MMTEEQFTQAEQQLIQRLRNAPRPTFKPHQLENVRQRLFQEMDHVFPSPKPSSPFLNIRLLITIIIVVVAAAVITLVLLSSRQQPKTAVTVPVPSPTTALEQDVELTPNSPATEAVLVIEGPVEAVFADSIIVLGMDIQVDKSDPILALIQIGETVRVEGIMVLHVDTMILSAVNITIIKPEIILTPQPGGGNGLPANCRVTLKGGIKCSKGKESSAKLPGTGGRFSITNECPHNCCLKYDKFKLAI
jgi:hypothetical protein